MIDRMKKKADSWLSIADDVQTPMSAKILIFLAVAYLFWPFDIIPDFIPVIGYLDDMVIVPLLLWFAFRLIENAGNHRPESEKTDAKIVENSSFSEKEDEK